MFITHTKLKKKVFSYPQIPKNVQREEKEGEKK
jgi:hypothetical protein